MFWSTPGRCRTARTASWSGRGASTEPPSRASPVSALAVAEIRRRPCLREIVQARLRGEIPPKVSAQPSPSSGCRWRRCIRAVNLGRDEPARSARWHVRVTMDQFPLGGLAAEDFGYADAHCYRLVASCEVDGSVLKTGPECEVATSAMLQNLQGSFAARCK